jgi:dTDP-glucose 4,6-dehydratase
VESLLITGGAGFIGSNFVHYVLDKHPDARVVVYDKLTYAGNLDNLRDVADDPRYSFVHGDICDSELVERVMREHGIEAIVNFAAETHVDRSILEAGSFIQTDVYGTHVLLEAVKELGLERMLHVSTDEVYGSVTEGSSVETDNLLPNSPYSASKAGGDLMCRAYHVTYGVPVVITRGSNNFGPYQYPEKVIPLFITNALDDQRLPIYGDGLNVRDWLYVVDHCQAIDLMLREGRDGEVYNVGGDHELTNLEVTEAILEKTGKPKSLMQFVEDRPGHDRRYSLDCSKIRKLGWRPRHSFEEALEGTVRWYADNRPWWEKLKTEEYRSYYQKQYGDRQVLSSSRS